MMRFGGGIDGTDFRPGSVALGQQWATNRMPYIAPNGIDQALPTLFTRGTHTPPRQINFDGGPVLAPKPINFDGGPVAMSGAPAMAQFHDPEDQGPAPNVLASEGVRATGPGPYDDAYRQNLATYAGGQFVRPPGGFLGGNTSGRVLSFNPTGGLFGNTTGGGNAPVLGMPDSLLGRALSGNPFKFAPPPPPPPPPDPSDDGQWRNPLRWWRDQFLDDGGPFGGRRFMMDME